MKRDEIEFTPPMVDLLYPDEESFKRMKKRRAQLDLLPDSYVSNLEIERLAEMICPRSQFRAVNLLRQLCDDERIINYRCDILEDFMRDPRLASTIKRMIEIMTQNDRRSMYKLSEPDTFTQLDDAIQAFQGFIDCMELMHEYYQKNSGKLLSEGVRKLFGWFEERYNDKHFKKLESEIAELREKLQKGIRAVTVAINLDERLVPVSAGILDFYEQPFELKPSLLDRIIYHGAKFPTNVVKSLKHKYTENEFGEEALVNTADEQLFDELSYLTEAYVESIDSALKEYEKIGLEEMFALSYQLEFYVGAVSMIDLCRSLGLEMCRPVLLPSGERRMSVKGLFDPIYFNESRIWNVRHADKKQVVVNDISFDDEGRFYILTGANNGGKTTFLRAVGLCQVMAQAGLYVPAGSCEISLADYIYTHFPKEEQTGINASRFTTEIKEFKTISDTITDRSLLLMNESIQSTTPTECVDTAEALVRIFSLIGVRGLFATHLIDLARRVDDLNTDPDIRSRFVSIIVEVDEQTGERRYKIRQGEPQTTGRSAEIFAQFGIDPDEVRRRIKGE